MVVGLHLLRSFPNVVMMLCVIVHFSSSARSERVKLRLYHAADTRIGLTLLFTSTVTENTQH